MRFLFYFFLLFFFNDTATTEIYTLSLHDALPISYGIVSRSGSERTRSSPSHPASSARQRRARSSLGATSVTVRRAPSTSAAHANARAPAGASAIATAFRCSRRETRSRKPALRSASERIPPRRAPDPSAVALAIEAVHRAADALAHRDLGGFRGLVDDAVGLGPLVRLERGEHVLGEIAFDLARRIGRRDADAQAREALADRRHDRAHPVVRPRTATLAQPHLAQWKIHVVVDDEKKIGRAH